MDTEYATMNFDNPHKTLKGGRRSTMLRSTDFASKGLYRDT